MEERYSKPAPPKLARSFLQRFLRDDLAEEVLGDLDEKFHHTLKTQSPFRTKINYWYQTINYLRPFAIRKSYSQHSNNFVMFQHYTKIAWRNILRDKSFFIINSSGLA